MSGNTDFWRNDLFTQTALPSSGNNLFGANRHAALTRKATGVTAELCHIMRNHARQTV
jgi:hypothetical protein